MNNCIQFKRFYITFIFFVIFIFVPKEFLHFGFPRAEAGAMYDLCMVKPNAIFKELEKYYLDQKDAKDAVAEFAGKADGRRIGAILETMLRGANLRDYQKQISGLQATLNTSSDACYENEAAMLKARSARLAAAIEEANTTMGALDNVDAFEQAERTGGFEIQFESWGIGGPQGVVDVIPVN